MTALALLAISSPALRFVYVDPRGYVRLYGSPRVRSLRNHAREPDLSHDGKRFVYRTEGGASEPYDAMIEHDLATGKERILRWGNLRSPRYAVDGQTVFFTEMFEGGWSLLALDRLTSNGRLVKKLWQGPNGLTESRSDRVANLSDPAPQADGTVVVNDDVRLIRLDAKGRILDAHEFAEPTGYWAEYGLERAAPAPGKPHRILLGLWTVDADQRIVPTDGHTGALWIVGAKTMKGRRITPRSIGAMRPCWFRDGSVILFSGGRARGPQGIWSIHPDGTGLRFLVPGDEPSAGV